MVGKKPINLQNCCLDFLSFWCYSNAVFLFTAVVFLMLLVGCYDFLSWNLSKGRYFLDCYCGKISFYFIVIRVLAHIR